MAQGYPVMSSMISINEMMSKLPDAFDQRGFASLLDLIVLKIGAIVSEDRDPKKISQDELNLKKLGTYQHDAMKSLARPLNACDLKVICPDRISMQDTYSAITIIPKLDESVIPCALGCL